MDTASGRALISASTLPGAVDRFTRGIMQIEPQQIHRDYKDAIAQGRKPLQGFVL